MPKRLLFGLAVLLALLPPGTAGAEGDPARGAAIYERCIACHALARDRTGPRHCGLIGRRAGSLPGFAYSEALRRSGIVWDRRSLDRFLRAPLEAVPGTLMGYDGVKDDGERADLIAYLVKASATPNLCP